MAHQRKSKKRLARELVKAMNGRIHPRPVFLRQSRLTQQGPHILALVGKAKAGSVLATAEMLGRLISRIKRSPLPRAQLAKLYASRSAEQILRDSVVYVRRRGEKGPDVAGCVDYAHVAVACLRSLGLEAKFVRWRQHSFASFNYNGKTYFLDPFNARIYKEGPLKEVTKEIASGIEVGKKMGAYVEGRDAKDVGLTYAHFDSLD